VYEKERYSEKMEESLITGGVLFSGCQCTFIISEALSFRNTMDFCS